MNPRAVPAPGTLLLTTIHRLTEDTNDERLARLPGAVQEYAGHIEGDFGPQRAHLPAPQHLVLKPGALVMFVKNDSEGRWVNGTIGMVEGMDEEIIAVRIGEEMQG